jgi:ribosomal protein S18 acetylase RimI-like enzyme
MAGPIIDIHSATAEEMPAAIAAVVAGFITDPMARFTLPTPHDYLTVMPRGVRAFGGKALEHGSAYVTSCLRGAALWLPPGVFPDGEELEKIFRESTPPDRLDDVMGTFAEMEKWHPDEPHWYLPLIGVEPFAQGAGLGGALMRHAVDRCDEERALAYLESSNPRNISLYERHGFEVMGKIQVGKAPVLTPMVRRPR